MQQACWANSFESKLRSRAERRWSRADRGFHHLYHDSSTQWSHQTPSTHVAKARQKRRCRSSLADGGWRLADGGLRMALTNLVQPSTCNFNSIFSWRFFLFATAPADCRVPQILSKCSNLGQHLRIRGRIRKLDYQFLATRFIGCAWRMAHGAWPMAHGAWRRARGAWRMPHGAWPMAHGARRMAQHGSEWFRMLSPYSHPTLAPTLENINEGSQRIPSSEHGRESRESRKRE